MARVVEKPYLDLQPTHSQSHNMRNTHFHGVDHHFRIVSKEYNRNKRKDATTRQSDETLGPAYKIVANISFTEVDDKTAEIFLKASMF